MAAIITNKLRIAASDYFQDNVDQIPTYIYFGRTTPWDDENLPPVVIDSVQGELSALDEIVGMKRVYNANMISVIPRTNWREGVVFDEFTDKANIFDDKNPDTDDFYHFYVVTDEFNVYKCISNSNRTESTVKPTGTSVVSFQTPDGYIWKYMYTIKTEDAFRYMTPNWIPCYELITDDGSQQWLVQSSAVDGSIEHVTVVDGGQGHTSSNPPTVTILGNGVDATAVAVVDDSSGAVEKILVTNTGSGYTQAAVQITGGDGTAVSAESVISPTGGHGKNARAELGAVYKMVRLQFDSDESGQIPVDIDYRTSGIISEPLSNDAGVVLYVNDTKMFSPGQVVTGGTSTTTGTIRSINSVKKALYIESASGSFIDGENISSTSYNLTQLVDIHNVDNLPIASVVASGSDYKENSGDLFYTSNREKITRGKNQIESMLFIINF